MTGNMGFSFAMRGNAQPWRGTWGSPFGKLRGAERLGDAPCGARRLKARILAGAGLHSVLCSLLAAQHSIDLS